MVLLQLMARLLRTGLGWVGVGWEWVHAAEALVYQPSEYLGACS